MKKLLLVDIVKILRDNKERQRQLLNSKDFDLKEYRKLKQRYNWYKELLMEEMYGRKQTLFRH